MGYLTSWYPISPQSVAQVHLYLVKYSKSISLKTKLPIEKLYCFHTESPVFTLFPLYYQLETTLQVYSVHIVRGANTWIGYVTCNVKPYVPFFFSTMIVRRRLSSSVRVTRSDFDLSRTAYERIRYYSELTADGLRFHSPRSHVSVNKIQIRLEPTNSNRLTCRSHYTGCS